MDKCWRMPALVGKLHLLQLIIVRSAILTSCSYTLFLIHTRSMCKSGQLNCTRKVCATVGAITQKPP